MHDEPARNAAGDSFKERPACVKVFRSWTFGTAVQQQLDILGVQHIPSRPGKKPRKQSRLVPDLDIPIGHEPSQVWKDVAQHSTWWRPKNGSGQTERVRDAKTSVACAEPKFERLSELLLEGLGLEEIFHESLYVGPMV
jgi:hypothetical protein